MLFRENMGRKTQLICSGLLKVNYVFLQRPVREVQPLIPPLLIMNGQHEWGLLIAHLACYHYIYSRFMNSLVDANIHPA